MTSSITLYQRSLALPPSQETLLMHDEDVCLAAVVLLVGGAAVRTGIYVLAHPGP